MWGIFLFSLTLAISHLFRKLIWQVKKMLSYFVVICYWIWVSFNLLTICIFFLESSFVPFSIGLFDFFFFSLMCNSFLSIREISHPLKHCRYASVCFLTCVYFLENIKVKHLGRQKIFFLLYGFLFSFLILIL